MNRLLKKAPETLTVDGVSYPINTDFRSCLLSIMAIEDEGLDQWEKVEILLENLYGENCPENIPEAVNQALWFLSIGQEKAEAKKPRLMDWDIDGDHIQSAFLARGVNLDAEDMHWWTFASHITELPESGFTRIVYLRQQHQRGKLSKDERRECERIGWAVIRMEKDDVAADDEILAYIRGEA